MTFVSAGNMFVTFLLPTLHRPASVPSADLLDGRFALSINLCVPPRLAVKRRKQAFYTSCLLKFTAPAFMKPLFLLLETSWAQHSTQGERRMCLASGKSRSVKMLGIKEGDSRHSGLLRHLCAVICLKWKTQCCNGQVAKQIQADLKRKEAFTQI